MGYELRHARPSYIKVPKNGHPAVRRLFEEMIAQKVSYFDLGERAGVSKETIRSWNGRRGATLANLEAVLNVLGFELTVRRKKNG